MSFSFALVATLQSNLIDLFDGEFNSISSAAAASGRLERLVRLVHHKSNFLFPYGLLPGVKRIPFRCIAIQVAMDRFLIA
jgi:hypothetical protein